MSGSRRSTAIFFSSLFFSFFLFFFRATTRINHLVSQRGRGEISLSLSLSFFSFVFFSPFARIASRKGEKGKREGRLGNRRASLRLGWRASLNRDFRGPRGGQSSFNFQIDPDLNQKKKRRKTVVSASVFVPMTSWLDGKKGLGRRLTAKIVQHAFDWISRKLRSLDRGIFRPAFQPSSPFLLFSFRGIKNHGLAEGESCCPAAKRGEILEILDSKMAAGMPGIRFISPDYTRIKRVE